MALIALTHSLTHRGSMEWGGDWGDASPLWTKELKREVKDIGHKFAKNNDGTFFMAFEDFVAYFTSLTVCKCRTPGRL